MSRKSKRIIVSLGLLLLSAIMLIVSLTLKAMETMPENSGLEAWAFAAFYSAHAFAISGSFIGLLSAFSASTDGLWKTTGRIALGVFLLLILLVSAFSLFAMIDIWYHGGEV